MIYPKIPIFLLAAAMSTSTLVVADDDDEEPFEEAFLFFELNDTDGDLGFHGKIDGGPWKKMEIEGPKGRDLLKVRARGRLKRQGMTELFFESAEPCFPDNPECEEGEALDPEVFFERFPEGEYEVEGKTLDGEELESEVELSHIIPAAPDSVEVNGDPVEDECLEEVSRPVVLSWDAVEVSHSELGRPGPVQIRYYEVVIEIDESDFNSKSIIPRVPVAGRVSWTIPDDFFDLTDGLAPDDEYKFEILSRTNVYDEDDELVMVFIPDLDEDGPLPGNKSAMESCFVLE